MLCLQPESHVVSPGTLIAWTAAAFVSAAMLGCGGGGGAGTANTSPSAQVAASSLAVLPAALVLLDGRASADADGDVLRYSWALELRPLGSTASLSGANTAQASLVPDVSGDYRASLVVNDGKASSAPAMSLIRVRRDYQQPSYRLSQPEHWFSSADLRAANGSPWTGDNPLRVMQTVQVDIDGDGVEDILSYDSYSLDAPLTNPPPALYAHKDGRLTRTAWQGQALRVPHGVKLLVGDFNRDGYPDVFSLVAVDPPGGGFPDLQDFNHIVWGGPGGIAQATVTEFTDWRGFWYAGASGDIDKDGALDIVVFNFHHAANGVASRILWGDGRGGFRSDETGIGTLAGVDQAELVDINGDGQLDLVIDTVAGGTRQLKVLWGNGTGFDLSRSSSFGLRNDQYVGSLNFADLDGDGTQEIILSGVDDQSRYWVMLLKSQDGGQSWTDRTASYFDVSQTSQRFDRLHLTDIDRDGRLDLFAPDRRDNIRWIFYSGRFTKQ